MSWTSFAILMFAGGYLMVMNYLVILRWHLRRKQSSMMPLIGGAFCAFAMACTPSSLLFKLSWLPLLIDPGCAYLVINILYAFILRKKSKK